MRMLLASFKTGDVRRSPGIRMDSTELELGQFHDLLGQTESVVSWQYAGSATNGVYIDHYVQSQLVRCSGFIQQLRLAGIIDHTHRAGLLASQSQQTLH